MGTLQPAKAGGRRFEQSAQDCTRRVALTVGGEHVRLDQGGPDRTRGTELLENREQPSIDRGGALTRSVRAKRQRQANTRRPNVGTMSDTAAIGSLYS
jgi:hypothetical protein